MGKEQGEGSKLQKGTRFFTALKKKGGRNTVVPEAESHNNPVATIAARTAIDGSMSRGNKQGRPEHTQESYETQISDDEIEEKGVRTMEGINRLFRHIQENIPSIKLDTEVDGDCTLADIHLNVHRLIRAYEKVFRDMKDAKRDVGLEQERAQTLQIESNKRNNWYEGQLSLLRKKIDELDERARNLDARKAFLEREHREKISSLVDQHKARLNEKERAIDVMSQDHSHVKEALSQSFADVKFQILGTHQREKNKWLNEKRQIEDKHSRQLEMNQVHFNRELNRKEGDLQTLISGHDEEKEKMKDDFERELSTRVSELMMTIEDLKGNLVKRDHFKGMSDQILANRFQDIRSQIEQFACITWDEGLEYRWPISRGSLRNAPNERKTKQYILQNSLWIILYEKIFRTPFRVFGIEGKSFEDSWLAEFGRDRNAEGGLALCPPPTKKSEKWRYENIKVCSDATSKPEVEWDFDLKRDYESYLENTSKEVFDELEKVATISNSQRGKIKNLVKETAKLWVEVGQQRCRMFLLMSNIGDKPNKVTRSALDSYRSQKIYLVVMPELRRKGNVQGEGLETEELVMDCKGDFVMFDHF